MAFGLRQQGIFHSLLSFFAPPGEKRQQKDGMYHSAEGQKTPTA
jgi:hypothetical protein